MTLEDRISEHLEEHLSGLIDGERLRYSEIEHWVTLLIMAEEQAAPVKKARYYGLTFISQRKHIRQAIDFLTYSA